MFWEIFYELCSKKGMKPLQVVKNLGIATGSTTKWKNGSIPSGSTLKKLSDYFGVSVDYLLGKEDPPIPTDKGDIGCIFPKNNMRAIPLYESVSAGFGAMAQDYIVEYYPCYIASDAEAAETICIRVKGDSMYPKIEDGDVIQVHKQTSVDNGSIAVILIDGEEALVKRILYGKDWIELISINPLYPPVRFNGHDVLRVRVIGLVRKIIKDA